MINHDWEITDPIPPTYMCRCVTCGFAVFVCPGHQLYGENEYGYGQGMIVIHLSTDNRMDPDQIIEKFMPEMLECGSFLIEEVMRQ